MTRQRTAKSLEFYSAEKNINSSEIQNMICQLKVRGRLCKTIAQQSLSISLTAQHIFPQHVDLFKRNTKPLRSSWSELNSALTEKSLTDISQISFLYGHAKISLSFHHVFF